MGVKVSREKGDLDDSTIAQLIECGLVARYRNDPDGLWWARRAVREELVAKGWTLPPYTYAMPDTPLALSGRDSDMV